MSKIVSALDENIFLLTDIAIKKIMIENSTQETILIDSSKLEIWEKFKYRDSRK